MAQTDQYANWTRRLTDAIAGRRTDVVAHPDTPDAGYYRVRKFKGGPFIPVFYRYSLKGDLLCQLNGQEIDEDRARELWSFALENPIAPEVYEAAMQGEPWPDIDATVAEQIGGVLPGIGDNAPPASEADELRGEIETAEKGAVNYETIETDEMAAKAQSLRARLLELRGAAEKSHKKAKEPHLEAGRKVDKTWFPLRDKAEAAANRIRAALSAFQTRKMRAEAEERARKERERLAAEEAERARNAPATANDDQDGNFGASEPAPPIAPAAGKTSAHAGFAFARSIPDPAPPPAPIRGGYGRAASVGVVKVIKSFDDYDQLYATFKSYPEVRAVLEKLARQAVKNGHTVPGVTIDEEASVT